MASRFEFRPTPIDNLVVILRQPFADARGYLERMFCAETFAAIGLIKPIVQINHTLTRQCGVVRGMHFQYPPYAETKIVSCLKGEVFDVAIDLRAGSPTFLRWHGEVLSDVNGKSLYIPEGFAHGFQTLTENCEMLYFHTAAYVLQAEGGIAPTEPRVKIAWPLPIAQLSDRDARHPELDDTFSGIVL